MTGIAPNTRMGPVALNVAHLDRLLGFYQDQIGLEVNWQDGDSAGLGVGADDLLQLTRRPAAARPTGAAGLYHFALLLPTRKHLAYALRHLAERQTPLTGFADHFVSEAVYLSDPEGNGIEIYCDRPRDAWAYDEAGQLQIGTVALDLNDLMGELHGQDEPWEGMPTGTQVGHVHLHVGDLPAATAFYTEVLGFDFIARYGNSAAFVSAGGYHHHLGYNLWAGRAHRPTGALGLDWYTVRLPDLASLEALMERIAAAGLKTTRLEDGWLLLDPSGNQVRLTASP